MNNPLHKKKINAFIYPTAFTNGSNPPLFFTAAPRSAETSRDCGSPPRTGLPRSASSWDESWWKPWGTHGKTMENHVKTVWKPWENAGLTWFLPWEMRKHFYGFLLELMWIYWDRWLHMILKHGQFGFQDDWVEVKKIHGELVYDHPIDSFKTSSCQEPYLGPGWRGYVHRQQVENNIHVHQS